jgi:hypothetical protein
MRLMRAIPYRYDPGERRPSSIARHWTCPVYGYAVPQGMGAIPVRFHPGIAHEFPLGEPIFGFGRLVVAARQVIMRLRETYRSGSAYDGHSISANEIFVRS